jgi:hypothetical protein
MLEEVPADLLLQDFGLSASAGAVSGLGILDRNSEIILGGQVVMVDYMLTCRTDQFGALQYGSGIIVGGVSYTVRHEPLKLADGLYCSIPLERVEAEYAISEPTGSSSATFSIVAIATGSVLVVGESSYVLEITGSAAGGNGTPVLGLSAATLSITGSATGTVLVSGATVQPLAIGGAVNGAILATGASSGTLDITGTASGAVSAGGGVTGASSAALSITALATGLVAISGASDQPLAITGAANGAVVIVGATSATLTITGSAAGSIGAVATGESQATLAITGAAAGAVRVAGASPQVLAISGTAAGAVAIVGASAATLTISGTAAGVVSIAGASAQSLAISGSAAGVVSIAGASTQALTITGTAAGTVGSGAPTGPSDDFFTGSLNSFWTATLPGSSSYSFGNDGTDYYLDLVMPAGFNYDNYNTTKTSPRILQTVANGNFTVVLKALSTPTVAYSGQGIFVQGSNSGDWLRFDVFFNGSGLSAFAGTTVAGATTNQVNTTVVGGASYLRLVRTGNTWGLFYSSNGSSWTTLPGFSHTMTVAQVGVHGISTTSGYTARFDYVEFASDPITSEDG